MTYAGSIFLITGTKVISSVARTAIMMFAENVRLLDVEHFMEHDGLAENVRPTSGGGAFGRYYS